MLAQILPLLVSVAATHPNSSPAWQGKLQLAGLHQHLLLLRMRPSRNCLSFDGTLIWISALRPAANSPKPVGKCLISKTLRCSVSFG